MGVRALVLVWLLAGKLSASGGTPESWLDGTQSWDTTPQKELDLEARFAGGDGDPSAGVAVQGGLLDAFQLGAEWQHAVQTGQGNGILRAQWREQEFPTWRPAFALLGRYGLGVTDPDPRGGLLMAVEPFDHSLVIQADLGRSAPWGLNAGLWTPYLLAMLRLGAEAAWSGGSLRTVTPQAVLNAPGDLSLSFGARLDPATGLAPRFLLRLSYQLFPSP